MPSPPENVPLARLAAAAPAATRFLADEHGSAELPPPSLTRFAPAISTLHGANVLLHVETQRAAALALLELDGLARRIVLCTPDLPEAHLREAASVAETTIVVTDRPRDWATRSGLRCVLPETAAQPCAMPPALPTEWALFTSGTSGPPKLALHNLATLAGAIGRNTAAPGRVWSTFYDIRRYGGLQILLRALLGGGSMVFSGTDEPTAFLHRAAASSVDFLSGTPTHWRRALLSPAAAAIAPTDIRLSGEVADQAILDKLRATYPAARICHAFASTEAGVAFEVADGLAGFPAEWIGRPGAIELDVEAGTLRICSPRRATRYLGDAAGPIADAEGFVDTRDLVIRRDNRYHFAGRSDGVINVGGLKVNPLEVEAVVNRHPLVAMSRVAARRSPIIGQIVIAEVMLRQPPAPAGLEAEILQTCRAQLAAHKVPAAIRFVPALQVNAAGKLIRSAA